MMKSLFLLSLLFFLSCTEHLTSPEGIKRVEFVSCIISFDYFHGIYTVSSKGEKGTSFKVFQVLRDDTVQLFEEIIGGFSDRARRFKIERWDKFLIVGSQETTEVIIKDTLLCDFWVWLDPENKMSIWFDKSSNLSIIWYHSLWQEDTRIKITTKEGNRIDERDIHCYESIPLRLSHIPQEISIYFWERGRWRWKTDIVLN